MMDALLHGWRGWVGDALKVINRRRGSVDEGEGEVAVQGVEDFRDGVEGHVAGAVEDLGDVTF